MNTLKILALTLILSGCTLFPAKYDNLEYSLYISLAQQSAQLRANCGKPMIEQSYLEQMASTADRVRIYSAHRPDAFSKSYSDSIQLLLSKVHSGGSVAYCQASADNLSLAVDTILDTLGARSM